MAKKFVSKGSCRGAGKVYQLLEGPSKGGYTLEAKSSSGEKLPCRLVPLGAGEYVAVFADFAIKQSAILRDSQGGAVYTFAVHPVAKMLESKKNGLLQRELCQRIRNIDAFGPNSVSPLSLNGFTPHPDGVIVRGILSSELVMSSVSVVAYDRKGRVLGSIDPKSDRSCLSTLNNVSFSMLLPVVKGFLVLAVTDSHGHHLGVFACYKKDMIKWTYEGLERSFSNASNEPRYDVWLSQNLLNGRQAEKQRGESFEDGPCFSVIVPLYKTPLNFFREMADSVLAQTYGNWELILVNSTPEILELKELVSEYLELDSRIKLVELESNRGITENTAEGIKVAQGDFCCFFDHDDVLEQDILFEYAKAIGADPSIDLLYCDEDKLHPDGTLANPTFKPDFSLDMARDNNYICHLLTVRTSAMQKIEPSGKELDGAQDHAMVLKIAELGGTIHHVPKLLYHWRISETSTAANADSKPYATTAGILAVQQHLDRCGLVAHVECAHDRAFRYAPNYEVAADTACSVIVATEGENEALSRCIEGLACTELDGIECVLVCPAERADRVKELVCRRLDKVRICSREGEFNKFAWRNAGAQVASGNVLVFLDDDAGAFEPTWLRNLAGFAQREDVGVVGTMTCDIDGIIRQAGLSHVGSDVIRLSHGLHRDDPGYIYYPMTVRDVEAVDGACQAVSRSAFERIGGYDEAYAETCADLDLCYKVAKAGLKVIYTPEAAVAVGDRDPACGGIANGSVAQVKDKARLLSSWAEVFAKDDKWFSPHFSKDPRLAERYKFESLEEVGF